MRAMCVCVCAVWDGCQACVTMNRIDFSVPGLTRVTSNACRLGVVPNVQWEITDEQLWNFVP